MSRFVGPKVKVVRRLGTLPGFAPNTILDKNQAKRKKPSQYALRLQEKQKLRYNYGVTEGQLVSYFKKARRSQGATGEMLLQFLEMRLDNVVFSAGLASSIPAARQLVTHGHIVVNQKRLSIPNYQCKPGDEIRLGAKIIAKRNSNKETDPTAARSKAPSHLLVESGLCKVQRSATRQELQLKVQELFVVEYYSR